MHSWFPRLPVATACFSCSPPDLNFLNPYFIFMYTHYNHCHRATANLQLNILLLLLLLLLLIILPEVSFPTARRSQLLIFIWFQAQTKGEVWTWGLTYQFRQKGIVQKTRGKPRIRSEKRRLRQCKTEMLIGSWNVRKIQGHSK